MTVAGIVIGFLVVGALSLVLTRNVARLHRLVDQERLHIKTVDDISAAFHHLIVEIQQSQIASPGAGQGAPGLHAQLLEALANFRDFHRNEEGLPEDLPERRGFAALWECADALRPMAQSVAGTSSSDRRLTPPELARLSVIAHQIPEQVLTISRAHAARVTHLLDASNRVQRAILVVYLATFGLGGVLVVGAARVFRARIATPLQALAAAARRIAEGEQAVQVPVPSADEIGLVSDTFNTMSQRLAARERDLQAAHTRLRRKLHELEFMNEVGIKMLGQIGINERDAILRTIAEGARTLLSVDATAICLVTGEPKALVVHTTSGLEDAFRVNNGVVRCSAVCDTGAGSRISKCPVWRSEFTRSHFAFPLQRGGESRGLLCVATREERALSPDEQELLTALAAQAAITVEQSRLSTEVERLAVLEERGRIAREMHDGLAQAVSLLHLRIRQAQAAASREDGSPLGNALEEMAVISGDMYEEIRRSITGLRTSAPQEERLVPSLARFVQEFSARTRLAVEFVANGAKEVDLPPPTASHVLRIVQEALNNVQKHAETDCAWVRLECQDTLLRVSVEDRGCGFDPAGVTDHDRLHFGLRGMQERAGRCEGALDVASAPGCGTCVTLILPMEGHA